jgi:nitroreductase
MDYFELIQARRSIRAYQPRPVEEDKLTRILEAARRSPSAGNLQAYMIVIVRDAATRKALSRAALNQDFLAQAPVVLAFFADQQRAATKYHKRGVELYSLQDATIACAYAQLAAAQLGLGTVWVGAFDDAAVRCVLKTQADWRPMALLPIGYPAETPASTSRRPLDELAKEADQV